MPRLMEFARELALAGRGVCLHTETLHFKVLYGVFLRKGALVTDGLVRYFNNTMPCAEVRPSAPVLLQFQNSVRAMCRTGARKAPRRWTS